MKAGNNLGVVIPAGGLVGGRALPTRKWLAPTLLILLLLLLALSARAGTRLAIIADDRGTCVRAVPIVVGACSRLLPGTVIGYMPARKSSSGTVLLSIPIAVYEWYWMRWDDRTLPDGWVRGDVLQVSP